MRSSYIVLILFTVVLSLLLSVPVYAQTPVPTGTPLPTTTPYPTFLPTSTNVVYSFPTLFTCPQNNIAGWGTVTPDQFWSVSCSHCVITPQVTSTPNSTPTAGASPTPVTSPTVTATVPPTASIGLWGACGAELQCTQETPTRWHVKLINSSADGNNQWSKVFHILNQNGAKVYGLFHTVATNIYFSNAGNLSTPPVNSWVGQISTGGTMTSINWIVSPAQYVSGSPNFNTAFYSTTGFETWTTWSMTINSTDFRPQIGLRNDKTFNAVPDYNTINQEYWFSLQPISLPTTPTPTPTANPSYCASVNGGVQSSDTQSDPALSWSGVRYGVSRCVDIGGWDFSILGIDVSVPLIGICLQDVSFANVALFGMSFSIDAILYVLFGAWALRRMFTT